MTYTCMSLLQGLFYGYNKFGKPNWQFFLLYWGLVRDSLSCSREAFQGIPHGLFEGFKNCQLNRNCKFCKLDSSSHCIDRALRS